MTFDPGDHEREQTLNAVGTLIMSIDPGAMVQRFVLLAEVVDADGERALWTLTAPDAKPWDTLGLMVYGQQLEQAETLRE